METVGRAAFKTGARELGEFEAKVLAMEHGRLIWVLLARHEFYDGLIEEFAAMLCEPGPAILARLFPNGFIDNEDSRVLLGDATLSTGLRKLQSTLDKLWPEYARLLKRNRRAWEAYRKRYLQNPRPPDRALPRERSRPREHAERDDLIYELYQHGQRSDQRVANMLEQQYGIKMSRQAVHGAYEREKERRRLQTPKRNSR